MVAVSRGTVARGAAVVLAIAAASACRSRSEPSLDAQFTAAQQALRRGELADALSLADRGASAAESKHDADSSASFRLLGAEILIARLQPDAAAPILTASLASGPRAARFRARQQYLQAKIDVSRGRLREALAILDDVRAGGDRDLAFEAEILGGQARLRLGRWAEAESRLTAVVDAAAASGDHYHEALALNNLGMGRLVRSRWDDALPWFLRVLAFNDLEPFTVYAAALNNAGICYSRLGEFDRAIETQRRAVEIHKGRGPRLDYEEALGELGNTYVLKGDARQGVGFLRQALDVATAAQLWPDAALWAGNLAGALADLGDWDEAARFNTEARRLKVTTGTGKLVYNTLNAAYIASGRGDAAQAEEGYRQALASSPEDPGVRWDANAGLARLALAAHDRGQAFRYFEAALDTIEKTQSDLLHTEYKLSFLTRLIGFYQAYVDALVDHGDIGRALEVADSSRARVLAERQHTSAQPRARIPVLQKLAARWHSAFVFYWVGVHRSYVWVVTATAVRCEPLPPAADIERLVRGYQDLIDKSTVDPIAARNTAGDELYRLVVAPAEKWIPSRASLVIVPDGALHRLNFETLPVDTGGRRHYWIEDVEIELAPSLGTLESAPAAPAAAEKVLLVGNPSAVDPAYPPLAYAALEMTGVARSFPAADVLTLDGRGATVARYQQAHPEQFSILHFAAHAEANVTSPLDSAVILAGDRDDYKLYARDVAEERLQAELVTVSGCRSAGERAYSGEGLVGFAWAFLRAGAERVVAGLWDVDDQSTARLMTAMYAGLAAHRSPADALREAKLELIHAGGAISKPYYWGPFEMFSRSR